MWVCGLTASWLMIIVHELPPRGYRVHEPGIFAELSRAVILPTLLQAQVAPLPGFRPAVPMVFAGLYPLDSEAGGFEGLAAAMDKLVLTDASVLVSHLIATQTAQLKTASLEFILLHNVNRVLAWGRRQYRCWIALVLHCIR